MIDFQIPSLFGYLSRLQDSKHFRSLTIKSTYDISIVCDGIDEKVCQPRRSSSNGGSWPSTGTTVVMGVAERIPMRYKSQLKSGIKLNKECRELMHLSVSVQYLCMHLPSERIFLSDIFNTTLNIRTHSKLVFGSAH